MNFDDYQERAMTYRLPTACVDYALLNLSGEVGELHSLLAKGMRDGYKPDHLDSLKKELGDILWCLAAITDSYGFSLNDVATGNLSKLTDRLSRNAIKGSGDDR